MHRCSPLHNQGFDSWNGRRGCHWYPFAPPHYGATSRRGSSRPLDASHVIVVYSLQHAIWIYMIHVVSCSIVYSSYYIQYILCYCVLTCVWSPTGPHDWQTILDLILTTKKKTLFHLVYTCAHFRTGFLHHQARQRPCDVLLCTRDWKPQVRLHRQCLYQGGRPGPSRIINIW